MCSLALLSAEAVLVGAHDISGVLLWTREFMKEQGYDHKVVLNQDDQAALNSSRQETSEIKGFHDEPLKGTRKGQRSIRLNRL